MGGASGEESRVPVFNLPLCNELLDKRERTPPAWRQRVASAKKQLMQQEQFCAFPSILANLHTCLVEKKETIYGDTLVNWIFLDPISAPIQLVPKEMAEVGAACL